MCSVVGYIGSDMSQEVVLQALKHLEYRGYDSSGFACIDQNSASLEYHKVTGRIAKLEERCCAEPIEGWVGIGHTRWSTHGAPTDANAHPHLDCQKKIAVVHNGIIENFLDIKKELIKKGHEFVSETDTEVVAHLFEKVFFSDFIQNAAYICSQLQGSFALIVLMQEWPDRLFFARKGSPLCVGVGGNSMFIASDMLAFADHTKKVIFVPDACMGVITQDSVELYDFQAKSCPYTVQNIPCDVQNYFQSEHAYEHHMLKEIFEQSEAIHRTVDALSSRSQDTFGTGITNEFLAHVRSLGLVGCGTSWHAARIGQFFFEHLSKIPTSVFLASEMNYMPFFGRELYCVLSQSGETADTLRSVSLIQQHEIPVLAVTNVASSMLARQANGSIVTQAGPEVAVASTKAFATQLAVLYWLAHYIAMQRFEKDCSLLRRAECNLIYAAECLHKTLHLYRQDIKNTIAPRYAHFEKALFLGRGISYPFAMEAALKLKEVSYVFAQCYPAGELKHGPLALIDDAIPIYMFSVQDPVVYQKLVSNAQEVKARRGRLIVFAFEGQDELATLADTVFIMPRVPELLEPLVMSGVMQYFVYEISRYLQREIDKPRNLAKSVTVE